MTAAERIAVAPAAATASDYLGLSVEQRYRVVSQHFPPWLLTEPIEFPADHPTYGWACLVEDCLGALDTTDTRLLCSGHARQYRRLKDSVDLDEFVRDAEPVKPTMLGWALSRRPDCGICGSNREAIQRGYCHSHVLKMREARRRGVSEARWRRTQHPFPPYGPCSVPGCVHDGSRTASVDAEKHRVCTSHRQHRDSTAADSRAWDAWLASKPVQDSVTPLSNRGRLSLAQLPQGLQNEIRYALHRHANAARRTQWRPTELQKVVDDLAASKVTSLCDPAVTDLADRCPRGRHAGRHNERRIWLDLPVAARSLMVTEDTAKAAGWFDPVLVGSSPFPGTQGEAHRRLVWDLTAVSQRWLRDLIWEHLRDEALMPVGKRRSVATVRHRIAGIALLSHILRQNRDDHGDNPARLGRTDASAVKDTWDLWLQEQIPIPRWTESSWGREPGALTDKTHHRYMASMRMVLQRSHEKRRTPAGMDSFIFNLPEYPRPPQSPLPRPLSFGDFQLLVSAESIAALEALDSKDVGFADIWLTQAFQGGRIGETLKLRLGCVGFVGRAQPYFWRDISKVNVIDYGVPCHLPVYQRLLRRQEITRAKLRARYAEQLAALDERGRARLEAEWDRDKPLFPSAMSNPDLVIEISQPWFRQVWTRWFESLGLKGITSHQTRATLATSLLNNGAPPALVRQVLGHFSEDALAHYARYNDTTVQRHLQQVWAAGPGMDKPGTILMRPKEVKAVDPGAAAARIDLTAVPIEHGLCRYGPVVGGAQCPFQKNCSNGPKGPCEHFVLTGADLAYWERKRDAAYHFAEGAPNDQARDYILSQWHPWEPVLTGLREALEELGLLEQAEQLDLRAPRQDYFDPLFSTGFQVSQLNQPPESS
ncbi:MAG: site-specific integrase [Actinomycetia bacterium]|nr:site-specific integrase [Actinomycetes bacterium]